MLTSASLDRLRLSPHRPARIASVLETESDRRLGLVFCEPLPRALLLCGPRILFAFSFAVPSESCSSQLTNLLSLLLIAGVSGLNV